MTADSSAGCFGVGRVSDPTIDFCLDRIPKFGIVGLDVGSEALNYSSVPAHEKFLEVPEHFRWRSRLDTEFDKVLTQVRGVAGTFRSALD